MPGQETNDHGKPKEVEHEERHAHRVVSTAKLVVTFSAAIAATFVAAVMQVDHDVSVFDDVAALFMLVALGFTIRVVMLPTRPSEGPSSRFGLRLPVPLRELNRQRKTQTRTSESPEPRSCLRPHTISWCGKCGSRRHHASWRLSECSPRTGIGSNNCHLIEIQSTHS
jgi:hypothetical protein